MPNRSIRLAATLLLMAGTALPVAAQDGIDPTITNSVTPAPPILRAQVEPAPLPAATEKGSAGVQAARAQLIGGDPAGAYATARGFSNPVERRTIQWAAIRFGNGKVPYENVQRFEEDAPEFDTQTLFRTRMEQALLKTDPDGPTVIAALGGHMPQTTAGRIALAEAYVKDGQTERAARIVKYMWVNFFLDTQSEAEIEKKFGTLLDTSDYWQRAVHLLMHERARGTERIMAHLTPAQQSLAAARIAALRGKADAGKLIDRVDPAFRDTPLFWFTRAQYARTKGGLASAVTFLDQVQGSPPDAAEFWYERRLIARRALAAGEPKLAYRAAAGYTQGPEGRVVDANFHAGWIALSVLGDPQAAEPHFVRMAALSTLPESIASSNYWLGRTLKALGRTAEADARFAKAAAFSEIYYGQLAREALGRAPVEIQGLPAWRGAELGFDRRQLVRAARLLAANGKNAMAEPLVRRLGYSITDAGEFVLAARLAQEIGAHDAAILIADRALKRGVPLDLFHFPMDGIPKNAKLADLDDAAVYAIARQESRFDVGAVSRSGARGLMQLMPGTAKEVARKAGVGYSKSRLTSDAHYNLLLGSTYLAGQLKRYDGSLVLAAAAYNAGAGNVDKWIKIFGDPRTGSVDPVTWIEEIPFTETRKYVQRVMGNYLVYRARLGDRVISPSAALRRIPG